MKRRVLSFLLLFALLLSVMPTAAFATDDSALDEAASVVDVPDAPEETAEEAPDPSEEPAPTEEPAPSEEPQEPEEPEEFRILSYEETERSVPTENVASPVDMASGETKSGSFTISGGGVVRSPESGTELPPSAMVRSPIM